MIEELVKQVALLQQQVDGLIKPEVSLGLSLIASNVPGGSVATVSFSSIPSTFRHLVQFIQARTDTAAEQDNIYMQFNSDTGSNYDYEQVFGVGGTAGAGAGRAVATMYTGIAEGANSRASVFAYSVIFVLNYAVSNAEKNCLTLGQNFGDLSADTDLYAIFRSGHWRNTAAISTITNVPNSAGNFVVGSRFHLYGIY